MPFWLYYRNDCVLILDCWIIYFFLIVTGLISYNRLGSYITRNAFSWKMIIGKVWALIVNFATMKHGGAHGGAETFWWPMKLSDIPQFREKPTFLQLQEGRSGRGVWRGDFWCTWRGARGALIRPTEHFVAAKKCDFWNWILDRGSMNGAPPCAPPWYGLQNFKIWDVSINYNKKSLLLDQYSCF